MDFRVAVLVGVAQRHHATGSILPRIDADKDVAVWRYDELPGAADAVGKDGGAETAWQFDAGIVGVAR